MLTCAKCNSKKSVEDFYASKKTSSGKSPWCKSCFSEYYKTKYQQNKEQILQKTNLWKKNNREKIKLATKAWHEKHHEEKRLYNLEYAKQNSERRNANSKLWKKMNGHKVQAQYVKRRLGKIQRTPSWLSKEQLQQIETEYALARWCSQVMGEKYHVDHIVPLQGKIVSGLHVPWNLQVIPATQNLCKHNRF